MNLVAKFLGRAPSPPDRRTLGDQSAKLRQSGWWHSFTFPDGEQVDGVRSEQAMRQHLESFGLPDRLDGKRVLDIGAWDGWFSFEMERRGATVTALDCWDNPNFHRAKAKFKSGVQYVQSEVYDIDPATLGTFDIVLFFGVLYHLKHPLLALEKVCAVTRDLALIETFVTDRQSVQQNGHQNGQPQLEFYETDELSGQVDNWTGPNLACLLAFCRVAGFVTPHLQACRDHRAFVLCRRLWPEGETRPGPIPILEKVEHARSGGLNFDSRRDEYLTAWFHWDGAPCHREHLRLKVGPFGSIPLSVMRFAGELSLWQATAKLPPGLPPGFHAVSLAIAPSEAADAGPSSNSVDIALDVHETPQTIEITGVCDGQTWEPGALRVMPDGTCCAALWIVGLPRSADVGRVRVRVNGEAHRPDYVEPGQAPNPGQAEVRVRQVNLSFAAQPGAGPFELQVESAGVTSGTVPATRLNPTV